MVRWALVLIAAVAAGKAPSPNDSIARAFRKESIREPIADKILRLTPEDAPTRPSYLVPVRSEHTRPPELRLYFFRPGDKPKLLADPRGGEGRTLVFQKMISLSAADDDGDGLADLTLKAVFKGPTGSEVEKLVRYRNDGTAGYRLLGAAPAAPPSKAGSFPLDAGGSFTGLDGGWWIAVGSDDKGQRDVKLKKDGEIRIQIPAPGGREFSVEGQDKRAVAIRYEGTGCAVVKVIRLEDGGTAVDTDCTAEAYCRVTQFPKTGQCIGTVECAGSGGFRWKREFQVCRLSPSPSPR